MDIGSLVNRAWQKLSADLVNCIIVFLVGSLSASIIGGLTLGILGIPIVAGMQKAFRNVARGGKAEIGDIFSEFSNIGYWFKLWLVFLVIGVAAGILSIIPILGAVVIMAASLVLGYLLWFTIPIMLERRIDAFAAVKESIDATKNNVGTLIGPILVTIIIIDIGSVVIIGTLLTAPLGFIMMWLIYDEFYRVGSAANSSAAIPDTSTGFAPPPPADENTA